MARLEWTALALADLLESSPTSPTAIRSRSGPKDETEAKEARLPDRPRIYRRGRVEGTREMVLPNCLVVYAEDPEGVRILRVLHAAPRTGAGSPWSSKPATAGNGNYAMTRQGCRQPQ